MSVINKCCEESKHDGNWPYPCLLKSTITDRVYLVEDKYNGVVVQGKGIGEVTKVPSIKKSWHSEPHMWILYEGTVMLCNGKG